MLEEKDNTCNTIQYTSDIYILNKSPFEKEQSVYGWCSQIKFTDKTNGLTMGQANLRNSDG